MNDYSDMLGGDQKTAKATLSNIHITREIRTSNSRVCMFETLRHTGSGDNGLRPLKKVSAENIKRRSGNISLLRLLLQLLPLSFIPLLPVPSPSSSFSSFLNFSFPLLPPPSFFSFYPLHP
jgi:hypothetical protein